MGNERLPSPCGAVTFNIVTAVFTRGGGAAVQGAGKAGALAKGLSVVSKVGSAVDPMTYVIKGAGAGLSKVGDVMAHLKGLGHVEVPKISEGAYSLPEGAVEMPDGTIQLPDGAAIPEGATKLPGGRIKLPEGTVTLPAHTVKDPFTGNYTDAMRPPLQQGRRQPPPRRQGRFPGQARPTRHGSGQPTNRDPSPPGTAGPGRCRRTRRRYHTRRLGHIRPGPHQ